MSVASILTTMATPVGLATGLLGIGAGIVIGYYARRAVDRRRGDA
jgi:F0F1-type ATP synthase membrane subunit c/vacuolar-type H+-ATPase subunit K